MASQTNLKPKKNTFFDNLEKIKPDFYLTDQLEKYRDDEFYPKKKQDEEKPKRKREFNLFNYQQYYENELINRQIKELTQLIKQEIEIVKKSNSSLLQQVADIEKITLEPILKKPGVYHVRFLEIVLNILRQLRAKISESKTWLSALMSKKKRRGSLFAIRSKKMGTQYSLSQELQLTRAVQ